MQSIRHETKVKAQDIYLLQNEQATDQAKQHMSNNLENRNDKSNYQMKMIANGILAAEALEKSLINNTAAAKGNQYGEPVGSAVEPLPVYLTPPKTIQLDRPLQYDHRIPLRDRNYSIPYILPNNQSGNRFKSYNSQPPFRKGLIERQKVTKISMPPIRRDYITNIKPFPVQNQQIWSLQKHIVSMRGPILPPPYNSKTKFSGPIKISKKEFSLPAKNVGFQPDSVVVESGFTPIMRRKFNRDDAEKDSSEIRDTSETYDYPDQQQRRSDKADLNDDNNSADDENSELLIKTFEPMFIPSPLDNIMKSPTKRLSSDLEFMDIEDGDDKMALAGEKHAYYLPPDDPNNINKSKITKLYPAGTVVTYDGRAVVDRSLLDSEPDFPTPLRTSSFMSGIKSTEQLLNLPQFVPFNGEIPPLTPELMKPNKVSNNRPK